jgi:hypothetical protein
VIPTPFIFILIEAGQFLPTGAPSLDDDLIRTLVGGPVEAAFLVNDPLGLGDIIGYRLAGPDGLLPVSCVLGNAPTDEAIIGNVLIAGIDEQGRTRSLARDEMQLFRLEPESRESPARLHVRTDSGTLE